MVKPILTYGAEIWGFEYSEVIEQVQIQFCKQFLGVNNSVNNSVALGECGRLPLCIAYHVKCIKYWCKLLQMPDHRYPKNCYIMLKAQDDIGRNNWVTSVKMCCFNTDLVSCGYHKMWGILTFLLDFLNNDCYTQNWCENINSSTRCEMYKNIKSLLAPEKYLTVDMSFYLRKSLARFRCSSHELRIETGRH